MYDVRGWKACRKAATAQRAVWEGKRPDAGADCSIVQRARRFGDARGVLDTQMGHRNKSGCDKSKGLFTAAFFFHKIHRCWQNRQRQPAKQRLDQEERVQGAGHFPAAPNIKQTTIKYPAGRVVFHPEKHAGTSERPSMPRVGRRGGASPAQEWYPDPAE